MNHFERSPCVVWGGLGGQGGCHHQRNSNALALGQGVLEILLPSAIDGAGG